MSLTSKTTGRTAAEEQWLTDERQALIAEVEHETENAELQMLRAINKQLLLRVTDYEKVTGRLVESARITDESLREQISISLTGTEQRLIAQLRKQEVSTAALREQAAATLTALNTLSGTVNAEAEHIRRTLRRLKLIGIIAAVTAAVAATLALVLT